MLFIYLVIGFLIGRFVQVIANKLIYKNLDWKQATEFGYTKKTIWKLWLCDLLSIVGAYHIYSLDGYTLAYILLDVVLVLVMILTFTTDVRDQFILNIYTYPAIIIFFIGRLYVQEYQFWVYLSGGLGVAILLGSIMFIMAGKMGGGDLKLFIALGFYFGMFDLIIVLLISSFTGLLYGIFKIYKLKKNEPFAFGPFIVLGVMLMLIFDFNII